MTGFDRLTEMELDQHERWIRMFIQKGGAPFLGLQKPLFKLETRKKIHDTINRSANPFNLYLLGLEKWPAVFLTYLTLYIAEGFGEHGTFEVYPFIERGLGIRNITPSQKDKLWRTFRRQCIGLGLSVSPRQSGAHFMVDEYLRQAGFPLKYVSELTAKMVQFANAVGLADDDDPAAIRLWHQGLCERLSAPFPRTARKAVEADDTGYYVRTFINLLRKPPITLQSGDFESLMSQAIHAEGDPSKPLSVRRGLGIGVPQVLWQDEQLGIELPGGESNAWKISVGCESKEFHGLRERRFIPFDQELPREALVEHKNGLISRKFVLWQDQRNNRLLIFSTEGILIGSGELGSAEPISLEPGNYQVVSRFIPDGWEDMAEEVRNEPSLYTFPVFLEPGKELILTRGPASFIFKADSKPLIFWEGPSIKGARGHEIFCSSGTRLKGMIPDEFMMEGEAHYLFRINPGLLGETVEIPAEKSIDGYYEITIDNLCKNWKPGVTRLLAEIYRQGIQRPAVRSAIYFWNGLARVENRTKFFCSSLPTNLLRGESDNLLVDSDNILISYRDEDNRFFRMVFDLGGGKHLIFTSVVPGVFLHLKDYSISYPTERLLKKGMTLSVAWNSRSVLEIFSTTSGYLRLGKFSKKINYNIRLPLPGLVEYLGPTTSTLQFVEEATGYTEDLLHLVSPYEALSFSVSRKSNLYRILFTLSHQCSEVSLRATDIVSGFSEVLTIGCNVAIEKNDSGINGALTCEFDALKGHYKYDLQISPKEWPNGAWILELNVSIDGRWGTISNARGDDYCGSLIIMDGTINISPLWLLVDLKSLDLDKKLAILRRVHGRLLFCYASESWEELKWLQDLWYSLLEDFAENEEYASHLLALTDPSMPEGASYSWVPMVSLSACLPWLFTLPRLCFSDIPSSSRSLFLKSLSTMSLIECGLLPMFKEYVFHQIVACGFSNVHRMEQGEEPRQFSMNRYEQALKMEDLTERLRLLQQDGWQPGEGDYLGALHYLYAMEKLSQLYQDTLSGNEYRRGRALSLCRSLCQYPLVGFPSHLSSNKTSLGFITRDTESDLSVDQESVLLIARFLSLFARICRWETRKKGTLKEFITKTKQLIGMNGQFDSVLGYILYIGKEIFGFYLLLWEVILTSDCRNE